MLRIVTVDDVFKGVYTNDLLLAIAVMEFTEGAAPKDKENGENWRTFEHEGQIIRIEVVEVNKWAETS
ncbi:hypothetical protein LCGC14_0620580 [marine sediment metagenome]|uniref:Uncharacterized protein n=1 Tax=marine sediment metagenome TaxID=412755 RepID=A0A0F9R4X8_9ZZZZ